MTQEVDTTFPQGGSNSPAIGEPITNLTQLAYEAAGGCEVYIRLNYGLRSSKIISYWLDSDTPWCITNEIDDSHQDLTDAELWSKSNIGEALDKGALIFAGRD